MAQLWWQISHRGNVGFYGAASAAPLEHHNGCTSPVVDVKMVPGDKCLWLETLTGSLYRVNPANMPGPEWRGLGTYLVQKARLHALERGEAPYHPTAVERQLARAVG